MHKQGRRMRYSLYSHGHTGFRSKLVLRLMYYIPDPVILHTDLSLHMLSTCDSDRTVYSDNIEAVQIDVRIWPYRFFLLPTVLISLRYCLRVMYVLQRGVQNIAREENG